MRPACITLTRGATSRRATTIPTRAGGVLSVVAQAQLLYVGYIDQMLFIRGERPEDIAAIHEVHELAFGRPAEADLVDALRASRKATLSLVAVEDDRIVGHILFSPVTIDRRRPSVPCGGIGTDGCPP